MGYSVRSDLLIPNKGTNATRVGGSLAIEERVLTRALPPAERIDVLVERVHQLLAATNEGKVADYIPALTEADPDWFGLAFVDVNGERHASGDAEIAFSLQSLSKAFVFALVREEFGHEAVHERVGANNTGLPFDSVIALELNDGKPLNPMVNAGALATTAMMPGDSYEERWNNIREGLSRFAGRELEVDRATFESERQTNQRNRSIALLLSSYGRLDDDVGELVGVYTQQCSLSVTAEDVAVMGATLADGGTNPVTGDRVVSAETSRDTLAVLASCGLYERTGDWLYEIGLPAKSGVSGGIVAIAPGKGAVGAFSPRLDLSGNSLRGQLACRYLSRELGLNMFAAHQR